MILMFQNMQYVSVTGRAYYSHVYLPLGPTYVNMYVYTGRYSGIGFIQQRKEESRERI
jgi:hypothetical protein